MEETKLKLESQDAERLRRGEQEESIDRDSAWVEDMKWVSHFGDRDIVRVAEATMWLGSKDVQVKQEELSERRLGKKERRRTVTMTMYYSGAWLHAPAESLSQKSSV